MRGSLTEKEKKELRKMLEDQDKPADESWLMVEHYANLPKKQNPYGFSCKLCSLTHHARECLFKKIDKEQKKEEKTYTTSQYSWYNYDGEGD